MSLEQTKLQALVEAGDVEGITLWVDEVVAFARKNVLMDPSVDFLQALQAAFADQRIEIARVSIRLALLRAASKV